jgi:hypothetical protein
MLDPKVDQAMDELGFPSRFLRNFEAAKRRQLHIDVPNLSRSAPNPAKELQQLSLVPISHRKQVKERFEAAAGGPKIVNGLAIGVFRET